MQSVNKIYQPKNIYLDKTVAETDAWRPFIHTSFNGPMDLDSIASWLSTGIASVINQFLFCLAKIKKDGSVDGENVFLWKDALPGKHF